MYANVIHKIIKVLEAGLWENDIWKWQLLLRREYFDWEKLLVEGLMDFFTAHSSSCS